MPMTIKEFVFKNVAQQLKISKDDVTMDTVIPSVFALITAATLQFNKMFIIDNAPSGYTAGDAIADFEKS